MIVPNIDKIKVKGITSSEWAFSSEGLIGRVHVAILSNGLDYEQYPLTEASYYTNDIEKKGVVRIFRSSFPMTRRQFEAIAEYPVWFFLTTVRGVWE